MKKLTKKYKVVYIGNELMFPVSKEGNEGTCYPGNNTEYAEFDTYEEAQDYINQHNMVYNDNMNF